MAPIEAYDPRMTGRLLYFAMVWFRISVTLDNPVSLPEAINLIFSYPIRALMSLFQDSFRVVTSFLASLPLFAMIFAFLWLIAKAAAESFNLFPNASSQLTAVLYTMAIPFFIIGEVLTMIPIEVAVVIATIAFLDIVVENS